MQFHLGVTVFYALLLILILKFYVSAYGHGCRFLSEYRGKTIDTLSYLDLTMAGAYTGVVQAPVRQVMERIKSVMQIREVKGGLSPYRWSGSCLVDLVRKEGWRNGLFQGMSSVFLREVPQFAIYYPAYEFFKLLYTEVSIAISVVHLLDLL